MVSDQFHKCPIVFRRTILFTLNLWKIASHIWPNMQTNSVTRCFYLMACHYLSAKLGNALMKNDIYSEARDD